MEKMFFVNRDNRNPREKSPGEGCTEVRWMIYEREKNEGIDFITNFPTNNASRIVNLKRQLLLREIVLHGESVPNYILHDIFAR